MNARRDGDSALIKGWCHAKSRNILRDDWNARHGNINITLGYRFKKTWKRVHGQRVVNAQIFSSVLPDQRSEP